MVAVASQVGAAALHTITKNIMKIKTFEKTKYHITFVKEITYEATVEAEHDGEALEIWSADPFGHNEKAVSVTIGESTSHPVRVTPDFLWKK